MAKNNITASKTAVVESEFDLNVLPMIQVYFLIFALQIDFDRWRCDPEDDVEEEESRNVMNDYPGMYERLEKDEIGYRKGIRRNDFKYSNAKRTN